MEDYNKKRILLTGGAGFIGSNLLAALLNDNRVSHVRILDDLSNGYYENIEEFESHPKFEFIKGDICNLEGLMKWTRGCNLVSHQAALGSVPRSIQNPLRSHEVNVTGTLNVFYAAKELGIERVVFACSSSTYGDSKELPKVEDRIGSPLSPYAVTKLAIEYYADVFQKVYGLDYIGLRYFNIFGPKQSANNAYAAVIPLFCKAFIEGEPPVINGNGETSRDFTYVDNAVQANCKALFTNQRNSLNQIYNTACGDQISLNRMVDILNELTGYDIKAQYGPERAGDVKHSKADIGKIQRLLNYHPDVSFKQGLEKVYGWYKSTYKK